MLKDWLNQINLIIAGLIGLLLLVAVFLWIFQDTPVEPPISTSTNTQPSRSSFEQSDYGAIDSPIYFLESSPIVLQLPDLRKTLSYYGKNNRPDADLNHTPLYFAFIGAKAPTSIFPNTKTYLLYNKKHQPPRYEFSPNNAETSLWIDATAEGGQATVNVHMRDETGVLVKNPKANAQFLLAEKTFARTEANVWEIGKQRVDGTLLARQRARWYGTDKFLERHGGKEYQPLIEKQRIDFGEGKSLYSIYMQNGDVAVWDNERWKVVPVGEETLGKTILVVKKIDERLMLFELWDSEGKVKIALNLLKSSEPPPTLSLLQTFKFVSSRTRSQFIFEINKERVTLSPLDWLLQTDKEWKKLTTPEEIDAYVDRKLVGSLFVFEGVTKRGEQQILVGTLFNKARSEYITVEMAMDAGSHLSPAPAGSDERMRAQFEDDMDENHGEGHHGEIELRPYMRKDPREYQKP